VETSKFSLIRLRVFEVVRRAVPRWIAQASKTCAGVTDLIGGGCDCLIPAQPPKETIEVRRRRANDPDHNHTMANPAKGEKPGERGLPNKGYRPGRKSAKRRKRNLMDPGLRP
jgi:hypothetical protein